MYQLGRRIVSDSTVRDLVNICDWLEANPEFLSNLRTKKYTTKDTNKSFRIINSWETHGVLDNTRADGSEQWRKFSNIDIIYMQVLTKLREFGFSVQKLRTAKQDLEKTITVKARQPPINVFEYAYIRTIGLQTGGNTYLMVESNGHTDCVTARDVIIMDALQELPDSYVLINLNKFLHDKLKFEKAEIPIYDEKLFKLDGKGEIELLKLLRTKNYNSINITHTSDSSILIECCCDAKGDEEDENVLPRYGEILTKMQDGKIIKKTITEKIKIK